MEIFTLQKDWYMICFKYKFHNVEFKNRYAECAVHILENM